MSDANYQLFEDMRAFLGFTEEDARNVGTLKAIVAEDGPAITEKFYASLTAYPTTAAIIEGRVEGLKRTHLAWMADIVNGDYGRGFYDRQFRIGEVHVKVGIEPAFVESVMSVLRQEFHTAIHDAMPKEQASAVFASLVKVLDLALMIINLSYQDERLARISGFTGMSRKLLENLVKQGSRKK